MRGYDAGKKIHGRANAIFWSISSAFLLLVVVTAANRQDRNGAQLLLAPLAKQFWRLRLMWADGAYAGELETWTRAAYANGGGCGWRLCGSRKDKKDLPSCPGGGEWNGHSLGSAGIGDFDATTNAYRRPRKHSFTLP